MPDHQPAIQSGSVFKSMCQKIFNMKACSLQNEWVYILIYPVPVRSETEINAIRLFAIRLKKQTWCQPEKQRI